MLGKYNSLFDWKIGRLTADEFPSGIRLPVSLQTREEEIRRLAKEIPEPEQSGL